MSEYDDDRVVFEDGWVSTNPPEPPKVLDLMKALVASLRKEQAKRDEDWRASGEHEWRTVESAGDYEYQEYSEKEIRFPDGAVRWIRVPGGPHTSHTRTQRKAAT